ncbi:MAG: hypothetical protein A2X12_03875 [Bacteroidetes bacterium GWE2_29_8]|nr:MAG: hypothetical protein A2X12_03875 [Bacteroidetes bacterium GWE2_29_8]OFY21885.1 MAG: hypothetical protein A2X02_05130 [Bacteroidetes bacterium GWF2_29_10]
MRILIVFIFLVASSLYLSAQLNDSAFSLETMYRGDVVHCFKGLKTSSAYLGQIDMAISLDTREAKLWKNGLMHVHIINNHGNQPSEEFVKDIQTFDNIEAISATRLLQLWYKHNINNFTVTIGQHDLNSIFCNSESASFFINSSFGVMHSVSYNFPVSIFPITTLGLILQYNLNDKYSIQTAAYNGNPGDETNNPYNTNWVLDKSNGFIYIADFIVNTNFNNKLRGQYKLGAFYHSSRFNSITDINKTYLGNNGFYIIADQAIINKTNTSQKTNKLNIFVKLGYADQKINMVNYFGAMGLHYSNIFTNKFDNNLGIAIASTYINKKLQKANNEFTSNETAIELSYNLQLSSIFSIQPDLQYIINTGANSKKVNSLIGLIRFTIMH